MDIFKIAPFCEKQLRDINTDDLIWDASDGRDTYLYRRCNTYKGGGGYDKFEQIWRSRNDPLANCHEQFVVQLAGCPLRCPYCYVTPEGIHDHVIERSADMIVARFNRTKLPVFHLMGGAPALYIESWHHIISLMSPDKIFHSDLLLIEKDYSEHIIEQISLRRDTDLYAVSIKGRNAEQFKQNTGVDLHEARFWDNLMTLVKQEAPFYITFTGMSDDDIADWKMSLHNWFASTDIDWMLRDSFKIDLIQYEALK